MDDIAKDWPMARSDWPSFRQSMLSIHFSGAVSAKWIAAIKIVRPVDHLVVLDPRRTSVLSDSPAQHGPFRASVLLGFALIRGVCQTTRRV